MLKIFRDEILIKPSDIKPSSKEFEVLGVLNPGATRLPDGRVILYVRVIEKLLKSEDKKYYYSPRYGGKDKFEIIIDRFGKDEVSSSNDFGFDFKNGTKRLTYISHFRRVILDKNGLKIISIDQKPSFYGLKGDAELGVEDARLTKVEDTYFMTYVGLSRKENVSTYLAISKDCFNWERKGIIFEEQNKDVVIFPEKIRSKYVAFDRPEGGFEFTSPHIWIAYSIDGKSWGELKSISFFKKDEVVFRSGSGPPPIRTDKGWLLFFHTMTRQKKKGFMIHLKKFFGIKIHDSNPGYSTDDCYSVWAALFDLNNPIKLLFRSKNAILYPNKKREISFEGKKVIFPTGVIQDKDYLLLYCGLGDSYVGVKKIKLKEVLDSLVKF